MGFLHKPVWLLTVSVAFMLLVAFGLLFYNSWRHDRELAPIQRHLNYIADVQTIDDAMRALIVEYVVAYPNPIDVSAVDRIHEQLDRLLESGNSLDPASNDRITTIVRQLEVFREMNEDMEHDGMLSMLMNSMQIMRGTMLGELSAHRSLIERKRKAASDDKYVALGLLAGQIVVAFPLGLLVRRRISRPIDTMGFLMSLMTRQHYVSAYTAAFDPMLQPLFKNYNHMVNHLVSLEQEHRNREKSLSESVRKVTRLLIQQQGRVAQAERMGSIGEVAASVAHELRNPLMAIHMALQNLRQDLAIPEHAGRVDLVIGEIKRMNHQLNLLLDSARQIPEALVPLRISASLNELCSLVRYQINEDIDIVVDVPDDIVCPLPDMQFHQCIFNLIVNAGQSIEERPGSIRISGRLDDDGLRLTIEDNGPGFPAQILESGVRPFGTWRKGGTGLGLIMVRRFADDLGGSLRLENRDPHGARIVLTLPCGA